MAWDKGKFLQKIQYLIDTQCGGVAREFNRRIGQRDAASRWKEANVQPKIDSLVKICEEFNVTYDWLLSEANSLKSIKSAEPPPNMDVPEDFADICEDVREVLLSKCPGVAVALRNNIEAFRGYADMYQREKENRKVMVSNQTQIENLLNRIEKLEQKGKRKKTDRNPAVKKDVAM